MIIDAIWLKLLETLEFNDKILGVSPSKFSFINSIKYSCSHEYKSLSVLKLLLITTLIDYYSYFIIMYL